MTFELRISVWPEANDKYFKVLLHADLRRQYTKHIIGTTDNVRSLSVLWRIFRPSDCGAKSNTIPCRTDKSIQQAQYKMLISSQ